MEKLVQENFVFERTMLSETPENRIMTYKDGASADLNPRSNQHVFGNKGDGRNQWESTPQNLPSAGLKAC